eukprot:TRINITY_DN18256_c0_g1_i13.p1 TRINITY_DN18256_c0_g1~~TRINITY_DN18256_c0_g1_i13.p1  ORF type:complete len:542 (-),score=37.51 TRINITY_DN18256_c0_g1_i13:2768-4393(-)
MPAKQKPNVLQLILSLLCHRAFIILWIFIICGQLTFWMFQRFNDITQKYQQNIIPQQVVLLEKLEQLLQNATQNKQIQEQIQNLIPPGDVTTNNKPSKEIVLDNYITNKPRSDLFATEFAKEELDLIQKYEDCFNYVKENFKVEMSEDFIPGQQIYEENQIQWANNNWTETINLLKFNQKSSCLLCVRYKIWDGVLYVNEQDRKLVLQKYADFEFNLGPNEEQLLLASYLYQIPNSDFLVTFHATPQIDDSIPVIGPARNTGFRGFTMPHYYHWDTIAMTDQQLANYQRCIDAKYPRHAQRIPKAVFRGSSTDSKIKTTQTTTVLDIQRVKLGVLGRWHEDILDVGVSLMGADKVVSETNNILKIQKDKITPGDHNKYELIISMDGIGYANRVSRHMLDNTPLLIVESKIQEFFRHRMVSGIHYESLKADLADTVIRVQDLLAEVKTDRKRLDRQVYEMRNLARLAFNTSNSLHVTAYSISEYQKYINWQVKWEAGYEPVLHWKDTWYNPHLPQQFTDQFQTERPQAFQKSPCYKKNCANQ